MPDTKKRSHHKKKPAPPKVRVLTCTRQLRHDFEPGEIGDLGRQLAMAQQELGAKDAERKTVMQQFNSAIGEIANRIDGLTTRIMSGFEMKDVPCEERIDYEKDTVTLVRMDTGKVIDKTKPIPAIYRQMVAPIDPPPAGDKKLDPGAKLAEAKRRWRVRWKDGETVRSTVVTRRPKATAGGIMFDEPEDVAAENEPGSAPIARNYTIAEPALIDVVEVEADGISPGCVGGC